MEIHLILLEGVVLVQEESARYRLHVKEKCQLAKFSGLKCSYERGDNSLLTFKKEKVPARNGDQ